MLKHQAWAFSYYVFILSGANWSHATDSNVVNLYILKHSVTGRIPQKHWVLLMCFNKLEMLKFLWCLFCVIIWYNPFVHLSFLFYEKCFWKIFLRRLCYALQPYFAQFSIFSCYFLKNSNIVYPLNTSIVINKANPSFKQRFDFAENVKQNKLVKVFLPPPNGHGDCATDL